MTDCPGDDVWKALYAGQLSDADKSALYRHSADCQNCQRRLAALRDTDAGLDMDPTVPHVRASAIQAVVGWAPPPTFAEFRIHKLLGQGAMGQVYLAQDLVLDRPVAVKFISSMERIDKERFLIEARAIARLNHPNVVTLYRVGELDGRPYLVSELILGQTLDHLAVPIPWTRALEIGKDLAAGLAEAHRNGVLHRDVKPANVILAKSGVVKLLDFGLARLSKAPAGGLSMLSAPPVPQLSLTQPGALMGTPIYMSPEAWQGQDPSAQMDVYSLGALLYELCSGTPPHIANELMALGWKAVNNDAAGLKSKSPDVDPAFAKVVDRCLRRDPSERFASCVELHQALLALGQSAGVPHSEDPTLVYSKKRDRPPSPALPPASLAPVSQPPGTKQRRRQYMIGLGLGLSLLLAIPLLWRWKLADGRRNMVLVPGGEFTMGSTSEEIAAARTFCDRTVGEDCKAEYFQREPLRKVRISPFYLDITEVTNLQFADWLNQLPGKKVTYDRLVHDAQNVLLADLYPPDSNGLKVQDGRITPSAGHERMPVVQVSWNAALHYCQSQGKRLPTEAQWEFAARGSEGHRFPWGDGEPRCDGVVFGRKPGRECASLSAGPGPVGGSEQDRSPEGIQDLGGNVSEWVMDLFRTPYESCRSVCVDPLANTPFQKEQVKRVVRGGNWYMPGESCRAAGRNRWPPELASPNIGFRCAQPAE